MVKKYKLIMLVVIEQVIPLLWFTVLFTVEIQSYSYDGLVFSLFFPLEPLLANQNLINQSVDQLTNIYGADILCQQISFIAQFTSSLIGIVFLV